MMVTKIHHGELFVQTTGYALEDLGGGCCNDDVIDIQQEVGDIGVGTKDEE